MIALTRAQAHEKAGASNGDAGPNARLMRRNSAPAIPHPQLAGGDPHRRLFTRDAVASGQESPALYSRIDHARPKFRRSPGHSRPLDVSSLNFAGASAPALFGALRKGVAAPLLRILISNPSKTNLTAEPSGSKPCGATS